VGSLVMATGTAALLMPRAAGDKSQLNAWESYAVQPDIVPFDFLNHLHNVETRFPCPQTFLRSDLQCRDDSELE